MKRKKPTIRGLQRRVKELEAIVRRLNASNSGLQRDVKDLAALGDEPLRQLKSLASDGVEGAWTRNNTRYGECPLCDGGVDAHTTAIRNSVVVLICPVATPLQVQSDV